MKGFFNSNKFTKSGLGFNKQVISSHIRKLDFNEPDENTPSSSVSKPTRLIRKSYSDIPIYDKNAIEEVSARLQYEISKFYEN